MNGTSRRLPLPPGPRRGAERSFAVPSINDPLDYSTARGIIHNAVVVEQWPKYQV